MDDAASNVTVGALGGYRAVSPDCGRFGGKVNSDGYQIGLRAGYNSADVPIRGAGYRTAVRSC